MLASQFIIDTTRTALGAFVWLVCMIPIEGFASWILPTDMRFFAFASPFSDLNGRLKTGICVMLEGAPCQPGHFVCNVGHIPGPRVKDMLFTTSSALDIMHELDGDAPGFVSNVLCVVPDIAADCPEVFRRYGWGGIREINLSVWQSAEAAQAWYRKSTAHADILKRHRNGELDVFGNLLATLAPLRMQWQRRCASCKKYSEGFNEDSCSHCRYGKTYPIPRF